MTRYIRNLLCLIFIAAAVFIYAVPVTILHTNDTHSAYLPQNSKYGKIGGYAALEYYLNAEREKTPVSLYLDAGDQQTGSIFSSLSYADAIGGAVIKVFNYLHLDAATYGNHEFDYTQENTIKLRELANYPFITSNILDEKNQPFGNMPYQIFSLDSLKIGIMGLTLTELPEKVKRENITGLTILPYKEAIDNYIEEVDKQSDLIILLTHNGLEADSLLATVLDNRIDLIIGGHSHTVISEPFKVNGIYIASTGSYLNYLGAINIEVQNDRIFSYHSKLIPLIAPENLPPTPLNQFVKAIADSIDKETGKVIAHIPVDWIPDKFKETAVSKWSAEALKQEYYETCKPDLAIINNGGIRKAVPAGPVTLKDMSELFPFNNYIVLFSCYGRDLLAMEALNKEIAKNKPYDIVQTSSTEWKKKKRVWGLLKPKEVYYINGKPVDPDKIYRVVSIDYILGQWDKYLNFKPFDVQETGDLFPEVMIKQIRRF
ncbi:MAG TPA: bifunctional UDP-sugar hydrolase/5'-nucleotidase [Candidatus Cloacimonas sp.]|nr:bifunctional UDP-sugar hydrolase/5'-nucleotidase [Candidatus Cloacimonas sp.]